MSVFERGTGKLERDECNWPDCTNWTGLADGYCSLHYKKIKNLAEPVDTTPETEYNKAAAVSSPQVPGEHNMKPLNERHFNTIYALMYQYVTKRHEWWLNDYDGQIMTGKYINALEFSMRQFPELLQVAEGVYKMSADPSADLEDEAPTYDMDSQAFKDLMSQACSYGMAVLQSRWAISGVTDYNE